MELKWNLGVAESNYLSALVTPCRNLQRATDVRITVFSTLDLEFFIPFVRKRTSFLFFFLKKTNRGLNRRKAFENALIERIFKKIECMFYLNYYVLKSYRYQFMIWKITGEGRFQEILFFPNKCFKKIVSSYVLFSVSDLFLIRDLLRFRVLLM